MKTSNASNIEEFNKQVVAESAKRPVAVIFWAEWCGPCKLLKPKVDALAEKHGFPLVRVNAGDNRSLAAELKVRGVPTVLVYHLEQEVLRFSGDKSAADLEAALARVGTFMQPV